MDLSSYAELAVRLVNTCGLGHEGGDMLGTLDGLRGLVADREHLNHGIAREMYAQRQFFPVGGGMRPLDRPWDKEPWSD